MDDEPLHSGTDPSRLLASALRGVRKARGLRTAEVAEAMGLDLRTYQRFEEGSGAIDLNRVRAFAEVTDSDPFAIIASVWMQTPEFAVRTVDNKPLVVFTLALKAFHEDMREDVSLIEPRVWWGGFRRVFQDLAEHVRKRDFTAETWLEEQAQRLGLKADFVPRPRRRGPGSS